MTTRAQGTLARFATGSGRFKDSVAKPKLFQPTRDLKLSVFRVSGLRSAEIECIGKSVVREHPTAERLHGWGELSERTVTDAGLEIEYDDDPPRHANIIAWPPRPSEQKSLQQYLASRSTAVRFRPPIQVSKVPKPD